MKKIVIILLLGVSFLWSADKKVVFETTKGEIVFKMFTNIAPKAVQNFITHTKNGYYNGIKFHRVIPGVIIQGGDPQGNGTGGTSIWGEFFEDEFKPNVTFDKAGLLAMANRGPNTNGSQFFVTLRPLHQLNGRHTIFGEVISGLNIVAQISIVKTKYPDEPIEDIKIIKAYVK